MIVKHNHNCMLCSRQKTCFVFRNFSILFAICRTCYDQLIQDISTYEVVTDFCSFCERQRECRVISSFDTTMFFSPLKICRQCTEDIVEGGQGI